MRVAGKIHCQPNSRDALGYFSARASGLYITRTDSEIPFMLGPDALQMIGQCRADHSGQQCNPILITFGRSDNNLIGSEIYIFNAELQTFEQSQTGAIQDRQAVREAKVDIVSADAQPVSLGTSRHFVIRDPDEMYVEFIQQ